MNNAYVTIPDTNLATTIREALGLSPNDPIPQKKLEELEHLDANDRDIKDLTGIEKAMGLTTLHLYRNQISDIKPLANLTQLTELDLTSNEINDIKPIAGLTLLTKLKVAENPIQDMTPLQKLLKQIPDLELDIETSLIGN